VGVWEARVRISCSKPNLGLGIGEAGALEVGRRIRRYRDELATGGAQKCRSEGSQAAAGRTHRCLSNFQLSRH
jgi:hypothetical protein